MAYENSSSYSNRVAYYVDSDHRMVPDGSTPYSFASQAELDAAVAGTASGEAAENIQAARDRGATAICDTYFYIGQPCPTPYTGGDVALYDFYVMVETRSCHRAANRAALHSRRMPCRRFARA